MENMEMEMKTNNKEITNSSDESNEMVTKNEKKEATNDDVATSKLQRKLRTLSYSDVTCCIYKVPEYFRKEKEEYYKPSVVSIGPIFYGDPQLEIVQEVKLICLESFLQHPNNACPRLDDYIKTVKRLNKDIRDCYQEQKMLSHDDDDEFIEMIVLDVVFLLTFITRNADNGATSLSPFNMEGHPFLKTMNLLQDHIDRDLLMEENQLPFFVLMVIFSIACPTKPTSLLIDVACRFINSYDRFKNEVVDLGNSTYEIVTDFEHLLDLWWKCCCLHFERQLREQEHDNVFHLPMTAKRLFAAGVKFKVNQNSQNSFDIRFDKHTGELEIPKLELDSLSETFFPSILYFEACHYSSRTFFIDFFTFLSALIDTEEDIKVLQDHGVLSYLNGSEQKAVYFFNEIDKNIGVAEEHFNYLDVSRHLNTYANQPWNRWMAILNRDYFNHPWAIVSFIYAIILFILTLLQTITSFTKN